MIREQVLKLCYEAGTLAQVKAAQEARSLWLSSYPEDSAVLHMGESLSMLEEALKIAGDNLVPPPLPGETAVTPR